MQIKMGKTRACAQFQDKFYGIVSHFRKLFTYFVLNNYGCIEIFKNTEPFLYVAAR